MARIYYHAFSGLLAPNADQCGICGLRFKDLAVPGGGQCAGWWVSHEPLPADYAINPPEVLYWDTVTRQHVYTTARCAVSLPVPKKLLPSMAEIFCRPEPKCECGAFKACGSGRGQSGHSDWCPWHNEEVV